MNLTKTSLCAVLVLGGVAASHASTFSIVKPTAVTAVSSPVGGTQYQSINKIIDGSGLSTPLNTGDPVPAVWPTHTTVQSDLWVVDANNGTSPLTWTITLTLGSVYNLTGFHLWNENETTGGRSAKDYTVSYSTDGSLYTPTTATPTPFLASSNLSSYQGAEYSFANEVAASFVRFTIADGYGGSAPGSFVGLSEIRFETIPEPSSILLLGSGGLLVFRLRQGFGGQGRRARQCRM